MLKRCNVESMLIQLYCYTDMIHLLPETKLSRYELATKQEGVQFCKPPPHQQRSRTRMEYLISGLEEMQCGVDVYSIPA